MDETSAGRQIQLAQREWNIWPRGGLITSGAKRGQKFNSRAQFYPKWRAPRLVALELVVVVAAAAPN